MGTSVDDARCGKVRSEYQVSFKHLERAKEVQGKGMVVFVRFSKLPSLIKEIRGRKILYQSPVGVVPNRDYSVVYLIPMEDMEKLRTASLNGIKFYEILPRPCFCAKKEEKPHYLLTLASRGLYLKEIDP